MDLVHRSPIFVNKIPILRDLCKRTRITSLELLFHFLNIVAVTDPWSSVANLSYLGKKRDGT